MNDGFACRLRISPTLRISLTGWRTGLQAAAISHGELPAIHGLMSRYSDRPMDFADATLVYLAKRETITTVFTVDRADFETYRIDGRRRFRVLPANRP